MLQVAFILLCIAQIIHLSRHWIALNGRLRDESQVAQMRTAVDWRVARQGHRQQQDSLVDRIKAML